MKYKLTPTPITSGISTKFKLTPIDEIPKDEFDIKLDGIIRIQKSREKKYGIIINPLCHALPEHTPVKPTGFARIPKKIRAKPLCLFCGTPTNLYSHTPMFEFQPVCNGCRDLRNKTHWYNIGEALAPKTWSRETWMDRHLIKKRMSGGI